MGTEATTTNTESGKDAAETPQTQTPPTQTPEQAREHQVQVSLDEWHAAKSAAKKGETELVDLGDGSVAAEGEAADAEGAEGAEGEEDGGEKKTNSAEGEKKPDTVDEAKPPKHKDWAELEAQRRDFQKRKVNGLAQLEAREREVNENIAKAQADADAKVKAIETRVASVRGLDSDDPYEAFNALAKWKGWDTREAFSTINLRTLHGGERSVQEQLAATEKKILGETEQLKAEIKKRDEELAKEKTARAEAEEREQNMRLETGAKSYIADEFKKSVDAGKYRFLKRYAPAQAAEIAWADIKRHYNATCRKDAANRIIPGTGEEISLDTYLNAWENHLKQDYEALHGIVGSGSDRASSEGSGTDRGNGATQVANPGTQQSNGAQQRKAPGTVTRSLTAQRSENGRVTSDDDDWTEAKRLAKQRAART